MSAGIENLVANEILVPPGGDPVLASWDRPFFYITNLNAYPSTYGPVESDNIVAGWSVDYASSTPSFLVGTRGLVGRRGVGLFDQRRPDLDAVRHRASGRRHLVHRRHDRRQHAAEHHLGAGGRLSSPITRSTAAQTWNPITLPGVTQLERFRLGLLSR